MLQPESQACIALTHALEVSVEPARAASATAWLEADCFDLLDTLLAVDRASRGMLDQAIFGRFRRPADYAKWTKGLGSRTSGSNSGVNDSSALSRDFIS